MRVSPSSKMGSIVVIAPVPRPQLSAADQEAEVRRIGNSSRAAAAIVRCDGTVEELSAYLAGSPNPSWTIRADVKRGDLLLSTVRAGSEQLVASLCLVTDVTPKGVLWDDDSDVRIASMPTLAEVLAEAQIPQSTFRTKSGTVRQDIVDALARLVAKPRTTSATEFKKTLARCEWERSKSNRLRKLQESDGECECCRVNLRAMFAGPGDRGLEVHHRRPLSSNPGDQVQTALSDLAVLCATCHRLVHTDKDLRIDVIAARWALSGRIR